MVVPYMTYVLYVQYTHMLILWRVLSNGRVHVGWSMQMPSS